MMEARDQQIALQFGYDEDGLTDALKKASGKQITLTLTDNSTVMLSVKNNGKSAALRLHRIFLNAGDDIIHEIAALINDRRSKTPLINKFIKLSAKKMERKPRKNIRLNPDGKYYNLNEIFASLNRQYFESAITSSITWGKSVKRWGVRKRTLGSYSSHTNIIRLNPLLDSMNVPEYFVEYVTYHEMLHADMGIDESGTRRIVHSREFKKRERLFKHYEKAILWEKANYGKHR
jgi:predicted metal-dependent hydrolase